MPISGIAVEMTVDVFAEFGRPVPRHLCVSRIFTASLPAHMQISCIISLQTH